MFAPSDSNINDLDAIPQESLLDKMESKITININGVPHIQTITLNQPYQIVTFRVIGSQIIFNLQKGS